MGCDQGNILGGDDCYFTDGDPKPLSHSANNGGTWALGSVHAKRHGRHTSIVKRCQGIIAHAPDLKYALDLKGGILYDSGKQDGHCPWNAGDTWGLT